MNLNGTHYHHNTRFLGFVIIPALTIRLIFAIKSIQGGDYEVLSIFQLFS